MVRFTRAGHARRYEVQKRSVTRYFSDPEKWNIVYDYLQGRGFSKRFLDHFITDYARAYKCEYYLTDSSGARYLFNVYHSAQTILCGVHKKHMDPFRRRNKAVANGGFFEFGHGDRREVVNVPVLTFFRWAIRNKVLDYAREHEAAIKQDMAKKAQEKRQAQKRRRTEALRRAFGTVSPPPPPPHVNEVVIEMNGGDGSDEDDDSEEVYVRETYAECKQRPAKRRKRYRECRVDTVFHDNAEVVVTFNDGDAKHTTTTTT